MYTRSVRDCVIGVDLGGTNVRAGAFFDDGSPAGPDVSILSNAQEGTDAIFRAMAEAIRLARQDCAAQPSVVGLAVPGHVDDANGMVRWAPNLGETIDGVFHYWRDVPVRGPMEELTGLKVRMDNDANAAALGEYKFGSGKNSAKCLVMLTIGTGIGGGVVLSPDAVIGGATGPLVLVGGNKGGAELGHIIVQAGGIEANSGEYGGLEGYCQRDSIVRRAVTRLLRGRQSIIREMCGGDYALVTPKMLSVAANQGDELAIEIWAEVGRYLGVGIGSLINVFAPDVFAIGGQIAKAGEWLLGPAKREAENTAIPTLFQDCRIVQAEQLEDAGMMGGAALALEWMKWQKTQ